MKWSKLLANLIANATGAILDMDAEAIYPDPRLFDVERRQILEALAVMTALGVRPVALPGAAVPWLARAMRLPAPLGRPILTGSSAARAAARCRRCGSTSRSAAEGPSTEQTEVAWMNGAVARFGRSSVSRPRSTPGSPSWSRKWPPTPIGGPGCAATRSGSWPSWRSRPHRSHRPRQPSQPSPGLADRTLPRQSCAALYFPAMQTIDLVRVAVALVAGYLLGGIPFGIIVPRLIGGPDPRTIGSGRTGGANVSRAVGFRWAAVSGLLDVAKAAVAVLVVIAIGGGHVPQVVAALAAIVGHSRSPFIGFHGGRGVAPATGGAIIIAPIILAVDLPRLRNPDSSDPHLVARVARREPDRRHRHGIVDRGRAPSRRSTSSTASACRA